MRSMQALFFTAALALAACGKIDSGAALEAMKAGDFPKAENLLNAALAEKPGQKDLLAARFVLFRHLSVHASSEKQQDYLNRAIIDYDALAKALGVKANYADMEGSLRSSPEGASLILAARKPIYGE